MTVTASVELRGVLVVFSYLIVPSVMAMLFAAGVRARLVLGWIFAALGSALGVMGSVWLSAPTGASVVCAFGVLLLAATMVRGLLKLSFVKRGLDLGQHHTVIMSFTLNDAGRALTLSGEGRRVATTGSALRCGVPSALLAHTIGSGSGDRLRDRLRHESRPCHRHAVRYGA